MPGMQFPYPRKSSNPPPFAPSKIQALRRRRALRTYAPPTLGLLALLCFVLYFTSRPSHSPARVLANAPSVVIVTPIDPRLPEQFKEAIKDNRRLYASHHGYTTFFPNTTDYDVGAYPESWSTVPALRHAMVLHPHSSWIWLLASSALIVNTTQSLESRLLAPRTLEPLMIVGIPVIPPDSTVRTFANLKADQVNLIVSQDGEGIASGSMIFRTGDWTKFLLDLWFDPLYRSYNFAKAEHHTLEHIVQWHLTVAERLAVVPQRTFNSYQLPEDQGKATHIGAYENGDFVANFHGCEDRSRSCAAEMAPYSAR